jgi:hypothetical protein
MAIRKRPYGYALLCDGCGVRLAAATTKEEAQKRGVPFALVVSRQRLRRLHVCDGCRKESE